MTYEFEACRVSGDGNAIFPDEIIIDDEKEVVIHGAPDKPPVGRTHGC